MKRAQYFFMIAAIFAVASIGFSTVEANGQLDQVLENMQKNAKDIKSLYAKMNQEKRNKQIGGKEVYRGEIFFKRYGQGKDKVRINYEVPAGQVAAVVGNEIILYQPSINQVFLTTRQNQASKDQEFSFIATPYSSIPELKSRFNIVYKGEAQVGSTRASVLELSPKGRSAAQKITLWVSQSEWLPIKYLVVERNGDETTFTLSNIRRNPAIGDGSFKVNWPKNTKVVRQ